MFKGIPECGSYTSNDSEPESFFTIPTINCYFSDIL